MRLLIDFATPSAEFANAVRFFQPRTSHYDIYGCWLAAALWRADPQELPAYLADLDEVIAGRQPEARGDSANWLADSLANYAPVNANTQVAQIH